MAKDNATAGTAPAPTATDDAAIEADLLAQAKRFDAGELTDNTPEDGQPESAPAPSQPPTRPAAKPEDKPQDQQPPAEAPKPEPSEFQKKRTDQQRLADGWKKLEAEKEALRQERDQLARQRTPAPAPAPKPEPAKPAGPLDAYSPEQLEAAANRFEADGRYELAEDARAAAKAKREEAAKPPPTLPAAPATPAQPEITEAMVQEWNGYIAAAEKRIPEFADPKGEFRGEVGKVLNTHPELRRFPKGVAMAIEFVNEFRGRKKAEVELENLRKENAALKGKLTPAVGDPESHGKPKNLDTMSEAEAERELLRLAAEADGA